MKRFFVIILLFISILRALANPLPNSYAEISELQFRTDGSWILEISVYSYYKEMPIEAIWIKSNSGESMIKNFEDDCSVKILIIENENLVTPFTINPLQDSIGIAISMQGYKEWYNETLIYGYPNSKIRTPKTGQSIAIISNGLYSITNSPSIGLENDTTGMMGTIKGIVYDKNGLPFDSKNNVSLNLHYLEYFTFYTQSDGSYSTRFFSNDFIDISSLGYTYKYVYRWAEITPFSFSMQPDSVVIRDIYLTSDILTGINDINSNIESIIKIYPQPVKQQSFNYEISIPIKSLETFIIFRNMTGQEMYRFLVTENKGVIVLPENIKNGYYIMQLISNKKNYAATKLIVQH